MARKKEDVVEKVLDVDASIQGTIVFKDPVNLRINGDFDGKLDTKGTLSIGEKAKVKANITGDHLFIAGEVVGNIVASTHVSVVAPATIKGDIFTPSLSVSEGALIDGKLNMSPQDNRSSGRLPVAEVAKFLEVEEDALISWAEEKRIPAHLENGLWTFDRQEIEDWIQQEKVEV